MEWEWLQGYELRCYENTDLKWEETWSEYDYRDEGLAKISVLNYLLSVCKCTSSLITSVSTYSDDTPICI